MAAIKAVRVENGLPVFEGWKFKHVGSVSKGDWFVDAEGNLVQADSDIQNQGYAVYVGITPQYVGGDMYFCGAGNWVWTGEEFIDPFRDNQPMPFPRPVHPSTLDEVAGEVQNRPRCAAATLIRMARELYGRKG